MLKGLGPTSHAVATALRAIRTEQKLSLRALAAQMAGTDGALSHATLSEIERGDRRVSVDDLSALAAALDVSPVTLLLPVDRNPEAVHDLGQLAALTGTPPAPLGRVVDWVRGDAPLDGAADSHEIQAFRRRALPPWLWNPERTDRDG